MSGGSYEYFCYKLDDFICQLEQNTPLRKAFAKHLEKISRACHDIEWVDSGDYEDGREEDAIKKCLKNDPDSYLAATEDLIKTYEMLKERFEND